MSEVFNNFSLNEACREQHELVMKKGFEIQPNAIWLMLTVSELSEALEADRKNKHADLTAFEEKLPVVLIAKGCEPMMTVTEEEAKRIFKEQFEKHIKDTFEDEIADAFLRLMQLCGAHKIDIERHIQMKAMYNQLRPPKHGKAY
jgi:NTP pyrophosphatase (non-canonical NTP hydrolase)